MTPNEQQAHRDAASAALHRDLARRATRQRWGCLLLVAIPAVLFVALMWRAVSDAREWAGLRPHDVSTAAWENRHDRCQVANIDTADCAAMPLSKIEAMATKIEAEEHTKLCAEDVPEVAKREAKDAVKAALKAPATASFDDMMGVTHKGCIWIVSGDVDAQNGFGATLRNRWRVELRRIGKDAWVPVKTEVRQ